VFDTKCVCRKWIYSAHHHLSVENQIKNTSLLCNLQLLEDSIPRSIDTKSVSVFMSTCELNLQVAYYVSPQRTISAALEFLETFHFTSCRWGTRWWSFPVYPNIGPNLPNWSNYSWRCHNNCFADSVTTFLYVLFFPSSADLDGIT